MVRLSDRDAYGDLNLLNLNRDVQVKVNFNNLYNSFTIDQSDRTFANDAKFQSVYPSIAMPEPSACFANGVHGAQSQIIEDALREVNYSNLIF